MNNWKNLEIGKAILFNPRESIQQRSLVKKIAMEQLIANQKKIAGYEIASYVTGPKFRNGDTLLAKITPCLENGKTAQVSILDDNEIAFGSSEFIVLRENNYTLNNFIFYLAKSPAFRIKAISCMEGTSGRKRVNENSLKLQVLPIPDLPTQQKIAAVLSALDAKIELNQRINAELEAMAKTLYDYWFVQFDFPDEHGEPYKSSGGKMVWSEALKREIPAGWEVKGLGNYAQPIRGVTYKKEEVKNSSDKDTIPILRATNINNAVIDLHDMVYVPAELVAEDQILDKFDVLITMSSGSKAHVGKNAFYYFDKKVSFGAFCSRLSVKKNLRFYVNTHMQSDNFKKYIANVGLGTNINNLTNRHITEYKLLIPSEKLLLKYEEIVENFYNEIGNNIKESQTLTELRDWLLPMLMNGQVTVKTQDDIGNPNAA